VNLDLSNIIVFAASFTSCEPERYKIKNYETCELANI